MQKNLTRQLKAFIASLSQKSKEYLLAESQRDELSLTDQIGLIIFVVLLEQPSLMKFSSMHPHRRR